MRGGCPRTAASPKSALSQQVESACVAHTREAKMWNRTESFLRDKPPVAPAEACVSGAPKWFELGSVVLYAARRKRPRVSWPDEPKFAQASDWRATSGVAVAERAKGRRAAAAANFMMTANLGSEVSKKTKRRAVKTRRVE